MEMIDVLKRLSEIAETKPELVKDAVASVQATNDQYNVVQAMHPVAAAVAAPGQCEERKIRIPYAADFA